MFLELSFGDQKCCFQDVAVNVKSRKLTIEERPREAEWAVWGQNWSLWGTPGVIIDQKSIKVTEGTHP